MRKVSQHAVAASLATVLALLLVAGALAWWLVPENLLGLEHGVAGVAQVIHSWGAWGMAGSVGLMILHSFVPFPSEIVALANGMVYGPLIGTAVTWVGAMLGASAAFGLGRALGRPFVDAVLRPRDSVRIAQWSRQGSARTLLVARLIPLIAFNLINYAAALTRVSWWTFLWTTGLGILPLTVLMCTVGETLLDLSPWVWLGVTGLALLLLAARLAWRQGSNRGAGRS
jgi:uncharacterized membrane protein YdjX (TVP38/TMEM64 family)